MIPARPRIALDGVADGDELDVQVRFTSALRVVRVSGEITGENAHLVEDAIRVVGHQPTPTTVVLLDLDGVTTFDDAASGALERAVTRLGAIGVEVQVRQTTQILTAPLARDPIVTPSSENEGST